MPRSALKKISKRRGKKKSRQVRLGVLVLVILIGIILTGKFIDFLGALFRPYSPETSLSAGKTGSWDGRNTLNLVIKSGDVYLFSFSPVNNSVTLFQIPPETYIDVAFGFGNWPRRSVYGLGEGENPPMGAGLLKVAIANILGVPVDGYLIIPDSPGRAALPGLIQTMRNNPLSLFNLVRESKTDLSLKEYWDFWWGIRRVRPDKLQTINLGNSGISSSKTLADGSRVLILDRFGLDVLVQKQIEDSRIKDQSLSVGIFNATDHPGLAEKASRIVTNMGGRVIFTVNFNQVLDYSVVTQRHQSYTASRLREIFSSPARDQKPESFNLSPATADVNIILGEDYFLRYNGP